MTFPVDWVDNVTTDQQARTKDLHDRGGDVYFIIHHSVTRKIQDTIATFWSDREVSATWAIGPLVAGSDDIKIALTVPENRRPWTTASSLDDKACTVEVCDKELGGSYPVSQNAKEKLAEIAAYMNQEYGMPLDRTHVLSHQEVYARGMGSYATACPGGDLQTSMDWIVARAREIRSNNGTAAAKGADMTEMYINTPNGRVVHLMPGVKTTFPSEEEFNQWRNIVDVNTNQTKSGDAFVPPDLASVHGVPWGYFLQCCKHFGVDPARDTDGTRSLTDKDLAAIAAEANAPKK